MANKELKVTRFWRFQGTSARHDDGARAELTDGSQHVITVSPSGEVDTHGAPGRVRDAILASAVPHAAATGDDARAEGWDDSFDAAWDAADRACAMWARLEGVA